MHPVKPPGTAAKPDCDFMPKKTPTLLELMGRRIKQGRLDLSAREGRQLTQEDIAARLGVAQSTVGRWEAGLKEPDLETIQRIAALFGWTPEYVAFGTEPKEVAPTGAPPIRGTVEVRAKQQPQKGAEKKRGA